MKDKDLLADADKQELEVLPMTGEEMQKILAGVYATPKALIERLKEATKVKPDLKVLEGQKGEDSKCVATSDGVVLRAAALDGRQRSVAAPCAGACRAAGPARVIMLSSRSRSCSKLASSRPSSTRPRGSLMRIGSTWRPLTMIS